MSNVRTGSVWQATRLRVFREETVCYFCNEVVDQARAYLDRATGKPDPLGKVVHHLDPHPTRENVSRRDRLRLAHWACNNAYGDGLGARHGKTSRKW